MAARHGLKKDFVLTSELVEDSTTLAIHTTVMPIIIGYSTVFCKIRDFICTSLRSAEIVLDER